MFCCPFSKDVEENEAYDIKTEVGDSEIIGNKWTVEAELCNEDTEEDEACLKQNFERVKKSLIRIRSVLHL